MSPDAHAVADERKQLEDLLVREVLLHPGPVVLVADHRLVIPAEPLGGLGRQLLGLAERTDLGVLRDLVVQILVESLLHRRCRPGVDSNVALVDLGHPHAGDLADSHVEGDLGVQRIAGGTYAHAHVGLEFPDSNALQPFAVGTLMRAMAVRPGLGDRS